MTHVELFSYSTVVKMQIDYRRFSNVWAGVVYQRSHGHAFKQTVSQILAV